MKLLIFLFLFISLSSCATYYVSADGDDSNTATQAQSSSTPWKTIAKINSITCVPTDTILFRRGDVFIGSINACGAKNSATVNFRYGSYGSTSLPKPVIKGAITLSGSWTSVGNSIYSITVPTLTGFGVTTNPSLLFVDGQRVTKAREPNVGSWFRLESGADFTLTDTDQIGQTSRYQTSGSFSNLTFSVILLVLD